MKTCDCTITVPSIMWRKRKDRLLQKHPRIVIRCWEAAVGALMMYIVQHEDQGAFSPQVNDLRLAQAATLKEAKAVARQWVSTFAKAFRKSWQ